MLMLNFLGFCTLICLRCLQVACCLLVGKSSSTLTGSVVPACDYRETWSIGRWQLKWLEKHLDGLCWVSTCASAVRNLRQPVVMERQFSSRVISVHKTPHYCRPWTKLSHTLQFVIESWYWKAAPERIVSRHFHLLYLCHDVSLVELCTLCRDGLRVPFNSSSSEVPHAAFWSDFVT